MCIVLFVLGFLLSFSYQKAKTEDEKGLLSEQVWKQEYNYKKILTELQKTNDDLRNQLEEKQTEVRTIENELGKEENQLKQQVEEVKLLRKLLGKLPVKGEGVVVTITDAEKSKKNEEEDFIVHDGQIQMLLNEMYISGAQAISINGQIITRFSSVVCVGPVITVDNISHSTPFIISAIGEKETIYKGLTMPGGIIESLKEGNIQINAEMKANIEMKPVIHEKSS